MREHEFLPEPKQIFEYQVSDECGWRVVSVFADGELCWAEAYDKDGGEVAVNDNWWEKLRSDQVKQYRLIKESYANYIYVRRGSKWDSTKN